MSFAAELIFSAPVLIAAGAVGALTLEHGWGWVLAQWKARRAKLEGQAKSVYAEVTAQVETATAALRKDIAEIKQATEGGKVRLATLEADVAALKPKPAQ